MDFGEEFRSSMAEWKVGVPEQAERRKTSETSEKSDMKWKVFRRLEEWTQGNSVHDKGEEVGDKEALQEETDEQELGEL